MQETLFTEDAILMRKFPGLPVEAANLLIADHRACVPHFESRNRVGVAFPDLSPTLIDLASAHVRTPRPLEKWNGWRRLNEKDTFKPSCAAPSTTDSPPPPPPPPPPMSSSDALSIPSLDQSIHDFIKQTQIEAPATDPSVSVRTDLSAGAGKTPRNSNFHCFSVLFPGDKDGERRYMYVSFKEEPVPRKYITVDAVKNWMTTVINIFKVKNNLADEPHADRQKLLKSFFTLRTNGRTFKSHFKVKDKTASVCTYEELMVKLTKKAPIPAETPAASPEPASAKSPVRRGAKRAKPGADDPLPPPASELRPDAPAPMDTSPAPAAGGSASAPPPPPATVASPPDAVSGSYYFEGSACSKKGKSIEYALRAGAKDSGKRRFVRATVGTKDFAVRINIEMDSAFERAGCLAPETLDESTISQQVKYALGALTSIQACKHAKEEWFPSSPRQSPSDFEGFD
jgi:hypothetical protein